MEIPVYLFTGFMDSGKSSLICETLYENGFANANEKLLIIACEDGDVEFDEEKLKNYGAEVEYITTKEELNTEYLNELNSKHKPNNVFIEYNGTWSVSDFYETLLPNGWTIVQALCTVDSTTFDMYMQNMRQMMVEQFAQTDVVIFNRCTDDVNKAKFRGMIKANNRRAQIVYEREDGSMDERPEELPFDINADTIEISDADYALWFMDCMDNPKKYEGKTVHFLGLVYNPEDSKLRKGVIVPGRFAMTCCVEDIQFLGMMCKTRLDTPPEHRSWLDLTAKVKVEFTKEYKGKGPILYPIEMKEGQKPEDELVYFS